MSLKAKLSLINYFINIITRPTPPGISCGPGLAGLIYIIRILALEQLKGSASQIRQKQVLRSWLIRKELSIESFSPPLHILL